MSESSKVHENGKDERKDNRGRKKGSPRVPGSGRQKGTVNKKSIWLRDELESNDLHWGKEFKKSLDTENYKKAELLISLLPYLNPRLKERDSIIEVEQKIEELKNNEDILKVVNE